MKIAGGVVLFSMALFVLLWRLGSFDAPSSPEPSAEESESSLSDLKSGNEHFSPADCSPELSAAAQAVSREASCGSVSRPESPDSAVQLQVAYVRLSLTKEGGNAPLLILPGGPGDAMIPTLAHRVSRLHALAPARELILIDQRGTGASLPHFDCRSRPDKMGELRDCFAGLSAEHDVPSYNSEASAHDIHAVLDALTIPRVAVYGVSYGTRLAQVFSQLYPSQVQKLILDSVVPAATDVLAPIGQNTERALKEVFSICAADSQCDRHFPDGLTSLHEVIEELDLARKENPKATAQSGQEFAASISSLLYSPGAIRLLPLIVSKAKEGDFGMFGRLRKGLRSHAFSFSFAVHLSVQCQEAFPYSSAEAIVAADEEVLPIWREAFSGRLYGDYCQAWRVQPLLEAEESPEERDFPVLIMSGGLDPVTPRRYADIVLKSWPKAQLYFLSSSTHGVAFTPCGIQGARSFLSGEGKLKLPECAAQDERIDFHLEEAKSELLEELLDEMRYRL